MAGSLIVPVIDVHNDNFKELWPALLVAVKTASFIALDTELSGLGNRKSLLAESIEERYKAICHAARSRAVISMGIACYKKLDKELDTYLVQVYNITLLCSEEYIIEPQSVQFLVQHGFDFNKQYGYGIPYCKGNNKGGTDDRGIHIRALFTELLRARKPLVLHNGLIDMAFLYQSFYAQLPERLTNFTADLSEMFPAGIYDTKYVTEFELRLTASYLEYAYKKCQLDNSRSVTSGAPGPCAHIEFCQYTDHMSAYVDYRECPAVTNFDGQADICQPFSAFGWCPNGTNCALSHDTDLIILQDEKSKGDKRKKRKRQREKKKNEGVVAESTLDGAPENKIPKTDLDPEEKAANQQDATAESCTDNVPQSENAKPNEEQSMKTDAKGNGTCEDKMDPQKSEVIDGSGDKSSTEVVGSEGLSDFSAMAEAQKKKADTGTHRAGFDAYMTGYIFAYSCAFTKMGKTGVAVDEKEQAWLPTCLNKIYLSGKSAPLNVIKSTFSKSSKAHVKKIEMLWGGKK